MLGHRFSEAVWASSAGDAIFRATVKCGAGKWGEMET